MHAAAPQLSKYWNIYWHWSALWSREGRVRVCACDTERESSVSELFLERLELVDGSTGPRALGERTCGGSLVSVDTLTLESALRRASWSLECRSGQCGLRCVQPHIEYTHARSLPHGILFYSVQPHIQTHLA
eukprot:6087860-Prymnesium_polylepis.1